MTHPTYIASLFSAWLALACWVSGGRMLAQEAPPLEVVKIWQSEEGLPGNDVRALAQDSRGYLWAGTMYGAVKFDGTRFQSLDPAGFPELKEQGVSRFACGDEGETWLATTGGSVFCSKDGQLKNCLPSTSKGAVLRIYAEGHGQVLIIKETEAWRWQWPGEVNQISSFPSPDQGHVWRDPVTKMVHFPSSGKLWGITANQLTSTSPSNWRAPGTRILDGAVDGSGFLWIITDKAIGWHKDGRWQEMPRAPGVAGRDLQASIVSPTSTGIWMQVNGQLLFADNVAWRTEAGVWPPAELSSEGAFCDPAGRLWYALASGEIVNLAPDGKRSAFPGVQQISGNRINSFFFDREGNLWTATADSGLARWQPARFRSIGLEQGLRDPVVLGLASDREGTLWFGTKRGLYSWKGGQVAPATVPALAANIPFNCVMSESDTILAGSNGQGLFRKVGANFEQLPLKDGFPTTINALFRDRLGTIYLGSPRGLYAYRKGKVEEVTGKSPEFPAVDVRGIAEDKEGRLWVATLAAGVFVKERNAWRSITRGSGLPADEISGLFSATDGGIWIATQEGLVRWKDGSFSTFTRKQGLPEERLASVLADSEFLWLGSKNGIFRARLSELNKVADGDLARSSFQTFTREDGLPSLACSAGFQAGACRDQKGFIYFSTLAGVAYVNPDVLASPTQSPPVYVEECLANGSPVPLLGSKPVLGPGAVRLQLFYTGISLTSPEKVRYRYKMDSTDTDWREVGPAREAVYEALPPGDYEFLLQGMGGDGIWNENSARFAFTVIPHYWQTTWFRLLLILGSSGLALWLGIIFARLRLRLRMVRLEKDKIREEERLRLARDLHDDLGARLTALSLLASLEGKKAGNSNNESQVAVKAREMVQVLDEIVWAVNPRRDNLKELAEYLQAVSEDYLEAAGIQCLFSPDPSLPDIPLEPEPRHSLLMAVKEALQNVVKHSDANLVRLSTRLEGNVFIVEIQDDGKGFSSSLHNLGDGLNNMRERMARWHGDATIRSTPDQGTAVRLSFPLPKPTV